MLQLHSGAKLALCDVEVGAGEQTEGRDEGEEDHEEDKVCSDRANEEDKADQGHGDEEIS